MSMVVVIIYIDPCFIQTAAAVASAVVGIAHLIYEVHKDRKK